MALADIGFCTAALYDCFLLRVALVLVVDARLIVLPVVDVAPVILPPHDCFVGACKLAIKIVIKGI